MITGINLSYQEAKMLNKSGFDLLNTTAFMCYGRPTGESEEQHHQQWVHIDSCSFGITNQVNAYHLPDNHSGNFSQINVTRVFDECSLNYIGVATYNYIGQCEIHFCKVGNDYSKPLLEIIMENAQVISYQTELTTRGMIEHFSFHFSKIKMNYYPIDIDGQIMTPHRFEHTVNM